MTTTADWVAQLALCRHPEGGWYRETYRSAEAIARAHLPPRFDGDRAFSTAIYYLLESGDFSALHRIRQDEVWHHYDGSSLTLHLISPTGTYSTLHLGRGRGQVPQAVTPAGHFFAATVDDADSFTLAGCTVAPGFEFADFDLPSRADLTALYPHLRDLVERLTR